MWQWGLRISWLTQGLPTLSWPPTSETSPPKPVPFQVLQEKQHKDSPEHLDGQVAWMDRYFLISFWWSLSILLHYRIEIFPCLWNLVAISVLIEDALKFSLEGKIFFTSHQTPEWERPFMDVWSKDPQISSSADGKSRPGYIPLWGFLTQLPSCLPLRALSPFTLA